MSIAIEYLYKYIKKFDVNLLAGESGLNNKVRWTHIVENEEIASFIQAEEENINDETDYAEETMVAELKDITGDILHEEEEEAPELEVDADPDDDIIDEEMMLGNDEVLVEDADGEED